MRTHIRIHLLASAAALIAALLAVPQAARADAPARDVITLTALRSWTAPGNTRVVLDFSAAVGVVLPDSGVSRLVVLRVVGESLERPPAVPSHLVVRDGVVDSVDTVLEPAGATVTLWLADSTAFRAFTLPAMEDKPFRVVVDVTRPGGAAAEEKRLASIAAAKRRDRVRVVVIDAGHGGDDTGAHGPGGVLEKHVNFAIAHALADELGQIEGVRALLTRDSDYFIPLRERYRIAEKAHADLFISIHANSSRRRGSGSGTEVYFLSLHGASAQADADLADLENAADLVGGVPMHAEDDLVSILYDVKRSSALEQSQLLAETLLDHVAVDRRLESRGVKQAGFAVLKSVEFPSVLVESAFINNPVESRLLRDPRFQRQIAHQLAEGVRSYFERVGALRTNGAPGGPDAPRSSGS